MSCKQVSWKFMLFMMGSGLITCLLILFVLYKQRGYLKNTEIIGITIVFILSCLILVLTHLSFQKNMRVENTTKKRH